MQAATPHNRGLAVGPGSLSRCGYRNRNNPRNRNNNRGFRCLRTSSERLPRCGALMGASNGPEHTRGEVQTPRPGCARYLSGPAKHGDVPVGPVGSRRPPDRDSFSRARRCRRSTGRTGLSCPGSSSWECVAPTPRNRNRNALGELLLTGSHPWPKSLYVTLPGRPLVAQGLAPVLTSCRIGGTIRIVYVYVHGRFCDAEETHDYP